MTRDEDFKLLKILTCVLKVNMHCDGCRQKVKKLLQRIEGIYQVIIDAEQQKVTVSGSVDPATLIKKLVRAGKHAELWSQKGNQNQKQKITCIKDDKNSEGQKQYVMKNLESLKNKQKFPFLLKEDDDCFDCDDEDEELQFLRNKINQMTISKQKSEANNTKKSIGAMTSGSNNPGKKGNPNQNIMMKGNPGGIDQKTLTALKMNNAQLTGVNQKHSDEGKTGNDISSMMNLAGFHGNGANNMPSLLGANHNGIVRGGGSQIHPYNVFQGNSGGYPVNGLTAGHDPSSIMVNMNGYPSRIPLHQQLQMMYNRSSFIPPNTGYYYNYGPIPYTFTDPGYGSAYHSSTHMFSDENTSSCSIM